jgi:hypothetical protein
VAGLGLPIVGASVAAAATTFTVTNVNDSGAGSLRQAIIDANNGSGAAVIAFAIPGTGPFKISPSTDLDPIDVPVVVDGYSEAGSSRATANSPAHIEIQIDGGGIVPEGVQLGDSSGTTKVEGLSVTNFTNCGICLNADGQVAEGNFVGLAPDGSTEGANRNGILIAGAGAVVGGTTPAARNVIDTGGDINNVGITNDGPFTTMEGNWIGLNSAGTAGLGEGIDILNYVGPSITVGNVLTGDDTGNIWGVLSAGATGTVVSGNLIGTNPAGTAALGSLNRGVLLQADTDAVIGSSPFGGGNVIASSFIGVDVDGGIRATVSGNHIGVDATNTVALPNFDIGVFVDSGGSARVTGNTIAHSAAEGVAVGSSPTDVATATVEQNSIFDNGFLGIDLGNDGSTANDGPGDADAGPNSFQNFPTLTSVTTGASTTVAGTLSSTANAAFTVDFYANGDLDGSGIAEGQRWLGSKSVTTSGSGVANFTATGLAASTAGELFTATATNAAGETSEFGGSQPGAGANTAPTLAPIPDQSAQVGSQLAFTAHGSDSDSPPQTLTYSLVGAPIGAAIDPATGVFTWTPTAGQIGPASFTVLVTDNGTPNLSATTGVNVTVTAAGTTTVVTSSMNPSTYGQSVTFTATVSGGDDGGTVGFLADSSPIGGCGTVSLGGPNGNQASCATSTLGAGTHTVTATYSGDAASAASQGTLTGQIVNQAVLTVTASNGSMTYGGPPPAVTATITGFVNGETPAVLTAQPTCTANATATTPAGVHANTTSCSGGAAANYTFSYVNGTLTVGQAPLTVTASNATMTYGGTPPAVTAAITGFVNGETPAVLTTQPVCVSGGSSTTPAGTYPSTTSCSGAAAANYSFNYVKGTLTVNKAPLTVTASNGSMIYGGTPPPVTATIAGFVNGEGPAVLTAPPVCSANASPSPNAGTYPNRTSCSAAAAANYTFNYLKGTLTVTPAPLTVSADNKTRFFGQPNPALTFTVHGLVNGDTQAAVLTGAPTLTTTARVVGHERELHVDGVHQRHADGDQSPDRDHRDRRPHVTGVRVTGDHHRHGGPEPGHQRGLSDRQRGVHR